MTQKQKPQTLKAKITKLAEVEYKGWSDINIYVGSNTGIGYPFGLFRPRGYVDETDKKDLLEVIEDGVSVFAEVE